MGYCFGGFGTGSCPSWRSGHEFVSARAQGDGTASSQVHAAQTRKRQGFGLVTCRGRDDVAATRQCSAL